MLIYSKLVVWGKKR